LKKDVKHTQEALQKTIRGGLKGLATRQAAGLARVLLAPEKRLERALWWMTKFGGVSTKKILTVHGASPADFSKWEKAGLIEYRKREFKLHYTGKYTSISTIELTKKGWKQAGVQRPNTRQKESHFSHNLIVQAWMVNAIKYSKAEKKWGIGSFEIDSNYFHDQVDRIAFWNNAPRAYTTENGGIGYYKYDGLIKLDEAVFVIELERTPKKPAEIKRFEKKYRDAIELADGEVHFIILVQHQHTLNVWEKRLGNWGNYAAGEVRRIDAHDLLIDKKSTLAPPKDLNSVKLITNK
jgi:hypothetical protein